MASAIPKHLAVVMDGNGRWAQQRGLPRHLGHQAGSEAAKSLVESAAKRGIEVLTVFAFSSENWKRPPDEVQLLMKLMLDGLDAERENLTRAGIRLRFIGDRAALSDALQQKIAEAESFLPQVIRMHLVIAFNYGGQWDIVESARTLGYAIEAGTLRAKDIDASLFASKLSLADLPPVDLMIRTSGEIRISNFLLWQTAYAEFYFTETLWPDFDEQALEVALNEFASRKRRYGLTEEQLTEKV